MREKQITSNGETGWEREWETNSFEKSEQHGERGRVGGDMRGDRLTWEGEKCMKQICHRSGEDGCEQERNNQNYLLHWNNPAYLEVKSKFAE